MEDKQLTAVEWLQQKLKDRYSLIHSQPLFEQAKQMEKEQERQKLIDLMNWMNKVAANNPMAFETDHDDIVDMYLNGYYK